MEKTTIEELKTQIESLQKEVRNLKDIDEINILQRAYGYYLEHMMSREVIDLFSDHPDVSLTLGAGTYLGKEGVERFFGSIKPRPEFLHQVMLISGIVTVDENGKSAKGRWYGWGSFAAPVEKGVKQNFFNGIYNCEYIKEDAVWKIKTMRFDQLYDATPARGWVAPELAAPDDLTLVQKIKPDIPRAVSYVYPSGNIVPFHYKHPVTGKKTMEEELNVSLKDTGDA